MLFLSRRRHDPLFIKVDCETLKYFVCCVLLLLIKQTFLILYTNGIMANFNLKTKIVFVIGNSIMNDFFFNNLNI